MAVRRRVAGARTVWRLVRRAYAVSPLDGEGARRWGGRFNPPGVAVVYFSATLSLAALELFVHLDPDLAPEDLVAIPAVLPRAVVETHEAADLPAEWRLHPAPASLAELGAQWVRGARTAILSVPSAIIPLERNFVVNPGHPDSARITVGEPVPFSFDPRMWK